MLNTKCLDPETGVDKPFENVSCQGRNQNFFQGGSTIFRHFFKRCFFSAELILSNLSNNNDSRRLRGHAPQKTFEYLHTVMAILVLFEQFSGKVCLYFWPLTLSASPNMLHFVRTVSIMRA